MVNSIEATACTCFRRFSAKGGTTVAPHLAQQLLPRSVQLLLGHYLSKGVPGLATAQSDTTYIHTH